MKRQSSRKTQHRQDEPKTEKARRRAQWQRNHHRTVPETDHASDRPEARGGSEQDGDAALDAVHDRSTTTSRYSLGSTSVASPDRFRLFIKVIRSLRSAACRSPSSAPNALFTGP